MRYVRMAIDFVVVLVFVAIGRHTHDHGLSLSGIVSTMWPFIVGAALGWGWVVSRGGTGLSPRNGLEIVVSTVVIGMVLRVIAGQGTAVAFIVVAFVFLGGTMTGWRLVARRWHRR